MQMATDPSFIVEFDLVKHSIAHLDFAALAIGDDLQKIYWIHCDIDHAESLSHVIEKLNLTADVVAAINKTEKSSQILEREDTLTLQMQCLFRQEKDDNKVAVDDIALHLTSRYCLTVAQGALPIFAELVKNLPNAIQYAKTPCFILFLILDDLITNYTDILYDYEIMAEDLDEQVRSDVYKAIVSLKKRVLNVKRHSMIVLNILLYTSGRDIKAVSKHCKVSLSTLLSNIQTVVNEADSIRDLLNSTLGQIDNALMREVNNTMRVLTAIAAIFMPPSLIAAIYGMNFTAIPELTWKYGYVYALVLILGSMLGMIYYFKKNKWY